MAEELPQLGQYDECAKAVGTPHRQNPNVFTKNAVLKRQILDGMSHYRIDPSIIRATDTPSVEGSRGIVLAAKFILSETPAAPTFRLRAWEAPFLTAELAVKKLKWNRHDARESTMFFKSLVHELSIMVTLSHPNITHLVGFVEDMQKGDARIIVPWEANGDVRDFLQSGDYDIPERVSLIKDVVSGLEYLHSRQPPICHGDLKSFNILVNSSYQAVITDFGAARIIAKEENQLSSPYQIPGDYKGVNKAAGLTSSKFEFEATTLDLTVTRPKYSVRWTAPEMLDGDKQDLPSDMWAMGWTCWEIITGRLPFDDLNNDGPVMVRTVPKKLPAIRKEKSLSLVPQLCCLMSDCWLSEPAKRIDVSTFCRKVRFVPSSTPSNDTFGGTKARPVALLMELGRMYSLQSNTALAEFYYKSALDAATRANDDIAKADAWIGLGESGNARSKYLEAEKAFTASHEIHSLISNDLGAANAL
ncbi:hypothetical protein FS837_001499, partial [Tulasnella sp. UAMH 9824]